MAQLNSEMARSIIESVNGGGHYPLTQWEQYQLAAFYLLAIGDECPPFTRDDRKEPPP